MPIQLTIFGGTFNPIHNAHLKFAEIAVKNLKLDTVHFVPNYITVHKNQPTVTAEHRVAMLRLALKNKPWAKVNLLEYDRKEQSFTIDTVNYFCQTYPKAKLYLLIGEDSLADFCSWYLWQDILAKTTLVIIPRATNKPIADFLSSQVIYLPTAKLNISSSEIRQKIQLPQLANLLPPTVLQYITQHGLYQ